MSRTAALIVLVTLAATATAADVRDPMRPPAAFEQRSVSGASTDWMLYSTAVSGTQRSAIVNGQVVSVGSSIGGARVVAIAPGAVRLATNEGEITLRLPVYEIKKGAR